MKYVNSSEVLPKELIEEIRKYVEGVYVYIPVKAERKYIRKQTERQVGIELRNRRIYNCFLSGIAYIDIANRFFLSEKSIRRIVLSKRKEMEDVMEVIKYIVNEWNLKGKIKQISHSVWDVNNQYVMKEYNDLSMMKRNIEMFKVLNEAGIPVAKVKQTIDGADFVENGTKGYLITEKLLGKRVEDVQKLSNDWFYRFGEIIGKLHQAFKECEKTMTYWNNSMLEEMKGWVSDNLKKYEPEYIDMNDVAKQINQLSKVYDYLPKQLIHRDVHVGNFLFEGNEFLGYVDFDLSQSNIRIFDLCYFLMGLVCKERASKESNQRWFSILGEVVGGYDSVMDLNDYEKESIPWVMMNIELLFVAFFLGENDDGLARDAGELFYFVKENEKRIEKIIKMKTNS